MTSSPSEKQTVSIIDLGIQNILSVENAFRTIGAEVLIVTTPSEIESAQFLVLPGVGAFSTAAKKLRDAGLDIAIRKHALENKKPLLGLCLGMQLLADQSDEFGSNPGLGLVPGRVVKLTEQLPQFRVPNIGWREVRSTGASQLFPEMQSRADFYHVHSFHFECASKDDVAGTSKFGQRDITSIVHRGNIFGAQFHPEKSQDAGLNLLHSILYSLK
jgi:imidazole glycerol-phosphate synthase subunit HisH